MGALVSYLKERKRILKRVRKLHEADVVVVSHAKSGRTWLAAMISHVYHQRYGIDEKKIIRFDNFNRINRCIPRIFFTHDSRKLRGVSPLASVEAYRGKKVILLVRDPRDVAVSSYFHFTRRHRHAEVTSIYDYVAETKLPAVITFLKRWQSQIGLLERSLVVRYEDLRAQPCDALARVMAFIGGEFSPEMIANAVRFASLENLRAKERAYFFENSRLHPGNPGDPDSFKVRRGQVGGYRDYFNAEQLARIDAMVADDLPAGFGYRPEGASITARIGLDTAAPIAPRPIMPQHAIASGRSRRTP